MAYNYIQSSGIVVADTSQNKQEVTQKYLDNFGSNLVTDTGTANILINSDTDILSSLQQTLALLANLINPNYAGGKYLDSHLALFDMQRSLASSTTVDATITGVAGTFIPAGSVASTTGGDRFVLVADVTIPVSGTIDTSFASEEKGEIVCQAGTLTSISDGGVLGWETVNNIGDGVIGKAEQSDESARSDRILRIAKGAKGTSDSIISGIYGVDGVLSLIFRENYTGTSVVVDNVNLLPNSIYMCVDGGDNEAIARALEIYKAPGVDFNNGGGINQSVSFVSSDSGQNYTVLFDRPNIVLIKIKITVKVGSSAIDTTQEIKNLILEYVNSETRNDGFKVGIDVSPFEIAANVAIDKNSNVVGCQVTKVVDNVFQSETIPIEIYEKASTSETLIEVILV